MKAVTLISIVVKLFALHLFMQFLSALATFASFFKLIFLQRGNIAEEKLAGVPALTEMVVLGGMMTLAYLLASVFLFLKARAVAYMFLPDEEETIHLSGSVSDDFQTCLYRCAGLYALIKWSPELVRCIGRTICYFRIPEGEIPFLAFLAHFFQNRDAPLSAPFTGTLLGLILVFKTQAVSRLIKKCSPKAKQAECKKIC